jgi:hypothetical protein
MNLDAGISKPIRDAQKALSFAARIVATAPATPSARLDALQKMADHLRRYVRSGWLNPATVVDKIFEVAELHGLTGEAGSDKEAAVMQIAMSANLPLELHPTVQFDNRSSNYHLPTPPSLETKTPVAWKGTEPLKHSPRRSHALFRQWRRRQDGDGGAVAGRGDRGARRLAGLRCRDRAGAVPQLRRARGQCSRPDRTHLQASSHRPTLDPRSALAFP